MILVIGTGHRQHNAGNPADSEDRDKSQCVQHRGRKGYSPFSEGEQPVEYFNPGRHSYRHSSYGEEAVDHNPLAHGIEMVSPYHKDSREMSSILTTMEV